MKVFSALCCTLEGTLLEFKSFNSLFFSSFEFVALMLTGLRYVLLDLCL